MVAIVRLSLSLNSSSLTPSWTCFLVSIQSEWAEMSVEEEEERERESERKKNKRTRPGSACLLSLVARPSVCRFVAFFLCPKACSTSSFSRILKLTMHPPAIQNTIAMTPAPTAPNNCGQFSLLQSGATCAQVCDADTAAAVSAGHSTWSCKLAASRTA